MEERGSEGWVKRLCAVWLTTVILFGCHDSHATHGHEKESETAKVIVTRPMRRDTTATGDYDHLQVVNNEFREALEKRKELRGLFTFFSANYPQMELAIDNKAAMQKGVSIGKAMDNLSILIGQRKGRDGSLLRLHDLEAKTGAERDHPIQRLSGSVHSGRSCRWL